MSIMIKHYLLTSFIVLILDYLYLNLTKDHFAKQIKLIQGNSLKLNILGAICCYILLTLGIYYFGIQKKLNYFEMFCLGVFVYGVFDTTNMAIFEKWMIKSVIIDTLWGGILFASTKYLFDKIQHYI